MLGRLFLSVFSLSTFFFFSNVACLSNWFLSTASCARRLSNLKDELNREMPNRSYAFNIYVIARSFKILTQIKAIHEDLQYDFKEDLETLGELIATFPNIMKLCIYNGLDVNWLINFDIPDDIVAIQKDLRARGFLK